MTISLNNGRQNALVAEQDLALADFTTGVALEVMKLPYNSIVIGGFINVTEVFNSTTSDVLDLGHSDDDDEYSPTPINLQALGVTALTVTGYVNTGGLNLIGTWTSGGGTPTTGTAKLVVQYIIEDRATEVQTT